MVKSPPVSGAFKNILGLYREREKGCKKQRANEFGISFHWLKNLRVSEINNVKKH
jgi:hypothetical protein